MSATQAAAILADLQAGHRLTPLDALMRHGCLRLGARIHDLKAAGHPIGTHMVSRSGKRVAEYWLPGVARQMAIWDIDAILEREG